MQQKLLKSLCFSIIIILISIPARSSNNITSIGKFKDWESFTALENNNKICFAQSIPILRAPKKFERDPSRLFITFRPSESINNEVSVTTGYMFQKSGGVKAKTGKKTFNFFSQENFAWIMDENIEQKAFELVFREFWIQRAKTSTWIPAFKQTFEMSWDEFYERLSKYKRKDLKKILPSKTLKIQDIFS